MSHHAPKPLPEELARLVRAERPLDVPATAEARVRARLGQSLRGPAAGGGNGGGGGSAAPPQSHAATRAWGPMWTAGAYVLGVATGGLAVHAFTRAHEAPPVALVAPIAPPSASPAAATPTTTAPPAAPDSAAPAPTATEPSPTRLLAEERALLDVARAALNRGEGEQALAAVERHARRHPNGQLAEEREALGVQALVLLSRAEEARARADRFERKYPRSVLLPAVRASTRASQDE